MDDLSWYEPLDADKFKCFICFKEFRGNESKARKHGKSERHRKIAEIRNFNKNSKVEDLKKVEEKPKKIPDVANGKNSGAGSSHIYKKAMNKNGVTNLLRQFHKSESNCDVLLKARNGQLKAHKFILISACKFFKEIFQSSIHFDIQEETVILMLDYDKIVLEMLLEFFYTGEVFIPKRYLNEFRSVCKVLNLKPLIEHLKNFCQSAEKDVEKDRKPEITPSNTAVKVETDHIKPTDRGEKIESNIKETHEVQATELFDALKVPSTLEKLEVPEETKDEEKSQTQEAEFFVPLEKLLESDDIIDNLSNFLNFEGKSSQDLEQPKKIKTCTITRPVETKNPPVDQIQRRPYVAPTIESTQGRIYVKQPITSMKTKPLENPGPSQTLKDMKMNRNKRRNPNELSLFPPLPIEEGGQPAKKPKLVKCVNHPKRTVVPKIFQNSPHIRACFEFIK